MNNDQLLEALTTLTTAAEQRVRAEVERTQAEQRRISIEEHKLRLEQENNAILCRILQETLKVSDRVGADEWSSDHDHIMQMLESILALTQVIALRVGGSDYEVLLNTIRNTREGGKVQITMGDGANVGNIVEGTQNITSNVISGLIDAINTNKPERVEQVLNTLPADIVDVAFAAIQGPLVAAKMVAQKVGNRWRVMRDS